LNGIAGLLVIHPTICVCGFWAGVDNAWEQEKLEARKMLENAAGSYALIVSLMISRWLLMMLFLRNAELGGHYY